MVLPKELVQKIIQCTGNFIYSVSSNTLIDFRTVNETIGEYSPFRPHQLRNSNSFCVLLPITFKKSYVLEKIVNIRENENEYYVILNTNSIWDSVHGPYNI